MEMDADIPKARDRRRSLMLELRNSNFQKSVRNLARVSPEVQASLLEQLHPDEREEELEIALHGERSWQVRALTFVHSPLVEWTLSLLLVADLLINFFDLYYLEPRHPDCYVVVQNAICGDGSEPSCAEGEDSAAQSVLDASSIVITCIFMAENLILLAVLGVRQFFTNIFHAIDFFVVAFSLALTITFAMMGEQGLANIVGLLLLVRLWRFVSLGYGLMSAASKQSKKDVESLGKRIQELEALLKDHGVQSPAETGTTDDAHVLT